MSKNLNTRTASLKRRLVKFLRRKTKFKEHRRLRNIQIAVKRKTRSPKRVSAYHPWKEFTKVEAPENFSFRENPKAVISFINKLAGLWDRREQVFVSLRYVEKIDYDAIVVLLSIMIRFRALKINFNGNFPRDLKARKVLEKSGFLKKLFFIDQEEYSIGQEDSIITHGNKNFDQKLTGRIIGSAAKTIWGQERRCPGVQNTLIELMQNTREHADPEKEGEKHWWLSVNHDPLRKVVCFSFIDYGVGIFKSLDSKPMGDVLGGWRMKAMAGRALGLLPDEEWLRRILHEELLTTVTGQSNRGKGLPGIRKALERNQISNLFVITNRVFADVKKDKYEALPHNFEGTFVYFELNSQNHNLNHGKQYH